MVYIKIDYIIDYYFNIKFLVSFIKNQMEKRKINLFGPSITKLEIDNVLKSLKLDWFQNYNKYQHEFEDHLKNFTKRKYALTTPCGTHAIHLALLSAGIKKGDEVIAPNATWIGSVAPIIQVGAKVVFADIDKENWCLSLESIKRAFSQKTKAIIMVNLYGNMPDYDPIIHFAKQKKLILIEDAAESFGSFYKKKPSGNFGDISILSFHSTKTITTGEGGALLCNDKKIYDKAVMLSDHGRSKKCNRLKSEISAFKYKMSSIQAAMGIAQLKRLKIILRKKEKIFKRYEKNLKKCFEIKLIKTSKHSISNRWLTTIYWSNKKKINVNLLINFFNKKRIETRPFFPPLNQMNAFSNNKSDYRSTNTRFSEDIATRSINLPSGLNISNKNIDEISKHIIDFFNY